MHISSLSLALLSPLFALSCASPSIKTESIKSEAEAGALFAFVDFDPQDHKGPVCRLQLENDDTKEVVDFVLQPLDPPLNLVRLPPGNYHAGSAHCGGPESSSLRNAFPDGLVVLPASLGFIGKFTVVLRNNRIFRLQKPPSAETWESLRKYRSVIPVYRGGLVSGFKGLPIAL